MDDKNLPESIPYIAYEAALARQEKVAKEDKERLEKANKRLWIALIAVFFAFLIALIATNAYWIHINNEYEDVVTYTQTVSQDSADGGNNTFTNDFIGGNSYGSPNGNNDNN